MDEITRNETVVISATGGMLLQILLTQVHERPDGPWVDYRCFFCQKVRPVHSETCVWDSALEWEVEVQAHATKFLDALDEDDVEKALKGLSSLLEKEDDRQRST